MKPGTQITIHINGLPIATEIDSQGVQRLPSNPHLEELVATGIFDLNAMASAVSGDRVSKDSSRWVYRNIGMSVCSYQSAFPEDSIVNPMWDPAQ